MIPSLVLLLLVFVLAGAEESAPKSMPHLAENDLRGGGPYSQQYHYNSYGGGGGGQDPYYTSASSQGGGGVGGFDTNTLLFIAIGSILILLALATVLYPMLNKNSGSVQGNSGGWGDRKVRRTEQIGAMAEKLLAGFDKFKEKYHNDD